MALDIIREEYRICLYEDILAAEVTTVISEEESVTVPEHYEESYIVDIGGSGMASQNRALEPKMTLEINGNETFTFKMYYSYYDNETGNKTVNPYIALLVNERKVKVKWRNEWHHFIIKSFQESTDAKSITYTCQSQHLNELSRTGFELEFDTELENNIGTVAELAAEVLSGTDWTVGGGDLLIERKEQAVYQMPLDSASPYAVFDYSTGTLTPLSINPDQNTILIAYDCVDNSSKELHFVYNSDGYSVDEGTMLVSKTSGLREYYSKGSWDSSSFTPSALSSEEAVGDLAGLTGPSVSLVGQQVSDNYRADFLARIKKQAYSIPLKRYVDIFSVLGGTGDEDHYGFASIEYKDPTLVYNVITNASDFESSIGWGASNAEVTPTIYASSSGNTGAGFSVNNAGLLHVVAIGNEPYITNSGPYDNAQLIPDGFTAGEKYTLRIKALTAAVTEGDSGTSLSFTSLNTYSAISEIISSATITKNVSGGSEISCFSFVDDPNFVTPDGSPNTDSNGFIRLNGVATETVSSEELTTGGVKVKFTLGGSADFYLEDVQIFKEYYADSYGTIMLPNEMSEAPCANIIYKVYNIAANSSAAEASDIVFSDRYDAYYSYSENSSTIPNAVFDKYSLVYDSTFEKRRTISEKNSNRFNLIQKLAETFGCWAKFSVETDPATGVPIYDAITGGPSKTVTFLNEESISTETGLCFTYGLDLNSISRTIDSSAFSTKIIVTPNSNEYATNGFCTIARSSENYSKDNVIYDFSYYVMNGMLSQRTLNEDLYSSTSGMGYLFYCRTWNLLYDNTSKILAGEQLSLVRLNAQLAVAKRYITMSAEEILDAKNYLVTYCSLAEASISTDAEFENAVANWIIAHPEDLVAQEKLTAYFGMKESKAMYEAQVASLEGSGDVSGTIGDLTDSIAGHQATLETCLTEKAALDARFFTKYASFIQEGTWTSEDYTDDNLYYLDALSMAYTSSKPKITYNISAISLAALPDFAAREFSLGDIALMQDTDFFGYVSGTDTPYRQQVFLTQVEYNFDSPEKDTYGVQNYKNNFEDLFQRITATTQSLQFSSGEYQRAANIVEANGTISYETLEASFASNLDLVYATLYDSVVYDSTGITVTDLSDARYKVRLTSRGVIITSDGGNSWRSAVTGEGISTSQLITGSINTEKIMISGGDAGATFKWDKYGINAYSYRLNENSIVSDIDLRKFIRLDRFGIYGVDLTSEGSGYTLSDTFVPTSRDDIYENASFGLVWDKFFMRNSIGGGLLEITSTDGICIYDRAGDDTPNIKMGRITVGGVTTYGISILNRTISNWSDENEIWENQGGVVITPVAVDLPGESGMATSLFTLFKGDGTPSLALLDSGDAYFSGTIYASKGQIGGITIDEGSLSGNCFSFTPNSFTIFSPESSNDYLMQISARQDEAETHPGVLLVKKMRVGETDDYIEILQETKDGSTSSMIRSCDYNSRVSGWAINSLGFAEFENAYIRGTLSTTVFEKDTIQVVNGAMMVRPSAIIKSCAISTDSISGDVFCSITFREGNAATFNEGEYAFAKGGNGTVYYFQRTSTENVFKVRKGGTPTENNLVGEMLISLGMGSSDRPATNIILNSAAEQADGGMGGTEAISVLQINIVDTEDGNGGGTFNVTYAPIVTLGADSSIISFDEATNAGISSKGKGSSASGNEIVFWAGASGTSSTDYDRAPFRVTKNGSVTVNNGTFTGTIYASRIVGSETETGEPSLTFYDSNTSDAKYIDFRKEAVNGQGDIYEAVIMSVRASGIQLTPGLSVEAGGNFFNDDGLTLTTDKGIYFPYDEGAGSAAITAEENRVLIPELLSANYLYIGETRAYVKEESLNATNPQINFYVKSTTN